MIAVMAKPAMNQGISHISFQAIRIYIRGSTSLQDLIIRENEAGELTEKVGNYGWELRAEVVASVWPDWP